MDPSKCPIYIVSVRYDSFEHLKQWQNEAKSVSVLKVVQNVEFFNQALYCYIFSLFSLFSTLLFPNNGLITLRMISFSGR